MTVELKCETVRGRALFRALRRDAAAMLRLLELESCELSVVIVGDRAIRRLNRDYRGKDEATDVLSFPQSEAWVERRGGRISARRAARPVAVPGESAPPIALGDVVISAETARRQARALRERPAARMRTLLIHGVLHLLGYDHEGSAAQARRMFARECELAARLAGESSMSRAAANGRGGIAAGDDSSPAAMPVQLLRQAGGSVRAGRRAR